MTNLKVLLVEDDPMVREVNKQFIERVDGFEVIDFAKNGIEGIKKMQSLLPDLVIMDIFMPQQDGLETLYQIRQLQLPIDCISVTAANDAATIQKILHLGVFDYIMKPFTFERMQKTLLQYKQFKATFTGQQDFSQDQLDHLLKTPAPSSSVSGGSKEDELLPKGFNRATLEKVLHYLQQVTTSVSADDVATNIGVARVTARRYLDYMEKKKMIQVDIQYGNIGRPINRYFIE